MSAPCPECGAGAQAEALESDNQSDEWATGPGRKSSYDTAIFVSGNSTKAHRVRRDDMRRAKLRVDDQT